MIQNKAAFRAEGLSATMWRQAESTAHETIAMRVITVVTLLYLPPTFVSVSRPPPSPQPPRRYQTVRRAPGIEASILTSCQTLFSTDIVKYQGDSGPFDTAMYSWRALQSWLEVSLPLMLVTLAATFGWVWYDGRKIQAKAKDLEKKLPGLFRDEKGPSPGGSFGLGC